MFLSFFVPVLLIPAKCDKISVCIDNDKDLRMDCLLEPELNKSNAFQFFWSSGDKEHVITTNYSRLSPETNLKGKSTVEERKPHNYRMTLPNFSDKLPRNSTLLCKLSGKIARVTVENGEWMSVSMV